MKVTIVLKIPLHVWRRRMVARSGTHGLIEAGVIFQLFDCSVSLLRTVRDRSTSCSS